MSRRRTHGGSFPTPAGGLLRKQRRWLGDSLQFLVDDLAAVLFPDRCRVCGRDLDTALAGAPRRGLSRLCSGRLRRRLAGSLGVPLRLLCPFCSARLRAPDRSGADVWPACASAFAPDPAIFALVHAFKYEGLVELGPWLGAHLARAARRGLPTRELVLVPVPLHAERLRARGFNQSLLLAAEVGRRLGAPVLDGQLVRRLDTPPLARLPHEEREARVRSAFARMGPLPRGDALLVLVDDVVTTGSTARAALAALGLQRGDRCAVLCLVGSVAADPTEAARFVIEG
jgi:predicted amidophosphoribosyltransferase